MAIHTPPSTESGTTGALHGDIDAAKQKMHTKIGSGREIKKLVSYLWDDEKVELMAGGTYGAGTGLVVLTNRRLLFLKEGIISRTTEDFPIEKISSVQWSSGMLLGTLTVFASGNKAEIKNMNKGDGKQIADTIRDRINRQAHSPEREEAGSQHEPDIYEQLGKLSLDPPAKWGCSGRVNVKGAL